MNGARWVQEDILTKHKDADLKVYAIWFSMYPTDRREAWPADILTDPRVVNIWDELKEIGTFYAERYGEMESTVVPESTDWRGTRFCGTHIWSMDRTPVGRTRQRACAAGAVRF